MSGLGGVSLGALVLGAAAVAGVAVEGVRRLAIRRDILDRPNARSSHVTPTPRGGGIAIVGVVLAGWALGAMGGTWSAGLVAGTLLVASVSAADDLRSLPARTRFAVQGMAAVTLLALAGPWSSIALPGLGAVSGVGWGAMLSAGLGVLWCLGLTNAYNFMDGIDGIAASQAVVAGGAWAVAGWLLGVPLLALTGGLVAGASLGFLVHNWSPARIFMGDVGSASLGFVFAALPLVAAARLDGDVAARVPTAGLLAVWPFVFDAVSTFVRRLRAGANVFEAHRTHLYQRMVIAGGSHRTVAGLYTACAVLSAGCGMGWLVWGAAASAWIGLGSVPVVLLGATRYVEGAR